MTTRPIGSRATLALFVASVLLLALALAVHWKGRTHAEEAAHVEREQMRGVRP